MAALPSESAPCFVDNIDARAVQLAVVPEPQAGTLITAGFDLPSKKTHRGTRKANRPKRRMKATQRKASQQGLPFIKRRVLSTLVSSGGSRETTHEVPGNPAQHIDVTNGKRKPQKKRRMPLRLW